MSLRGRKSREGVSQSVQKRLVGGASVLAIGSIVAKLIGALYRIPLTNILGAEGMGMYQLVFPVYALFMTLSTAGIPTALSRIVAERRALGESAKKYLSSALLLLATMSTLFALLTFGLAKPLAKWQGNAQTYGGFMVIAPSIILVGIIAGFRGWFQGEMNMLPTAVSNIIEQLVKLGVGIGLAIALMPKGLIYAVYGALFGVTISEFCALVYLVFAYLLKGREKNAVRARLNRDETREMMRVVFNTAFVAILMPLANFFDSIIIVNMLKLSGIESSVATAQYGLLFGPVNSFINMPIVLIMSLAVAIVPSVSMSRVQRDVDTIMLKSRLSIKIAYLLGIPFAFFFAVFAKNILSVIYPTLDANQLIIASNLLRIVSANVVLMSSAQIYISLLQALDKNKYAILSLICAIIVKVSLSLLLTRYVGILGSAIASVCMAVVSLAGVNFAYFKICGLHLEKNVALNLLSGVIMALCGMLIVAYVDNKYVCLIVGALVCIAVYVWLVFLLNLIEKDDIVYMPAKRILFKLHRLIRFWEYKNEGNEIG